MVYRDIRRLGTIELLDETQWHVYTARIGPEPLGEDFDLRCFSARLDGTTQAIKKAIMDQRRIAGVGNIYANEALFRARIHPARRTDTLSARERGRLHRAIRSVLTAALRAQGTTIRDYRTGAGTPGSYQHRLRVYGRAGSPCSRCGARLSGTHAIDGRATTFCRRCQPRGRQARS
jgi:formamidopyrimidine-DNA glycosylase